VVVSSDGVPAMASCPRQIRCIGTTCGVSGQGRSSATPFDDVLRSFASPGASMIGLAPCPSTKLTGQSKKHGINQSQHSPFSPCGALSLPANIMLAMVEVMNAQPWSGSTSSAVLIRSAWSFGVAVTTATPAAAAAVAVAAAAGETRTVEPPVPPESTAGPSFRARTSSATACTAPSTRLAVV
jgi:hypothetical protein